MKERPAVDRLKLLAGILLGVSVLLPLYTLPAAGADGRTVTYAWQLALDDGGSAALLALAYLWPALLLPLRRRMEPRRGRLLLSLSEPALAVTSAVILLAASTTAFSWTAVSPWAPWLVVPVSGHAGMGTWLGVGADGFYLLAWLVGPASLVLARAKAPAT